MAEETPNHYRTLGLDYDCTAEDVKAAYRFLAKEVHPDVNPDSDEARRQTQLLNEAYQTLSNSSRRKDYDRQLRSTAPGPNATPGRSNQQNVSQDVHLKIDQLLRGAQMDVHVADPGNADQIETYAVEIPPMTPPNAKIRVSRSQNIGGGTLTVRVKPMPDYRFRPRGSDLRCDLQVSSDFARTGGPRSIDGPLGETFEIEIPPNDKRGEVFKIEGAGLPRPTGGRGDIHVKVNYRPDVRVNATEE